jgi:hypothetical protein
MGPKLTWRGYFVEDETEGWKEVFYPPKYLGPKIKFIFSKTFHHPFLQKLTKMKT